MQINGSLKDHTHANEYFNRQYGNWQPGTDTVLKFPDGTMIQTKSVVFSSNDVQPKWYDRKTIWNNGFKDIETLNNNDHKEKGYRHERQYLVDWKVPFKSGTIPTIFQHYEVDQWSDVDRFFSIVRGKTTNSKICFYQYDPGENLSYARVTFLGIGLWK